MAAQDGVGHKSYALALREIRAGRKSSHWIWYVWPSLKSLRPGTSKPQFLLPDFAAVLQYLALSTLAQRLMEITDVAREKLQTGVAPQVLMGSATDAGKLPESLTLFALAAAVAGSREMLELFCDCLEALHRAGAKAKRAAGREQPQPKSAPELFDARALAAVREDCTAPPQLRRLLAAPKVCRADLQCLLAPPEQQVVPKVEPRPNMPSVCAIVAKPQSPIPETVRTEFATLVQARGWDPRAFLLNLSVLDSQGEGLLPQEVVSSALLDMMPETTPGMIGNVLRTAPAADGQQVRYQDLSAWLFA